MPGIQDKSNWLSILLLFSSAVLLFVFPLVVLCPVSVSAAACFRLRNGAAAAVAAAVPTANWLIHYSIVVNIGDGSGGQREDRTILLIRKRKLCCWEERRPAIC